MADYRLPSIPTSKEVLKMYRNPVKKPTPEDAISNPTIIKTKSDYGLSDNVEYGFLNTITYNRGIANNAQAPNEELKGFIQHTVDRKIKPSDGGAPPEIRKGTIGRMPVSMPTITKSPIII